MAPKHVLALALGLLAFCVAGSLAKANYMTDVITKDLKIFVQGKEFIVKGIAYEPAPLGIASMAGDQTGGGGLCSIRLTPYNEWKSACYDSDYFDGSIETDRTPPGPTKGWFHDAWVRDFALIKALGVNTLRLYNINPVTYNASVAWSQTGQYGVLEATGKTHIEFMDLAYSNGFYVIYPLIGDQTLWTNDPASEVQAFIKAQIDEVGNHPALLMFTVGNELPLYNDQKMIQQANGFIDFARNYLLRKYNRIVPFTTAVVDLPGSYVQLVTGLHVDVFSANAGYRGYNFQDLWSGVDSQSVGFPGFFNLSCSTGKPLLISEMGWEQVNNSQNIANPNWFNQQWYDLVHHIDNGCIGGVFFEYSDEPQKSGATNEDLGVVSFSPASCAGGTNSLQSDCWTPDTATPKPNLYNALSSGTVNGTAYNFNVNVFTLLGRPPAQLDDSSSPCTGQPVITGATLATLTGYQYVPPTTSSGGLTTGSTGSSTSVPSGGGSTADASTVRAIGALVAALLLLALAF